MNHGRNRRSASVGNSRTGYSPRPSSSKRSFGKSPVRKFRKAPRQARPAIEEETKPEYPMRINKYLAHNNYATRRGADTMIEKGQVFINGKRAHVGDTITEKDAVEVRRSGKQPTYTYLAFNKPVGMNTHTEPVAAGKKKAEKDIVSSLPENLRQKKLFPLGRLDKESEGLILLTDDGRVTDRLLNPKYEHEKTYEVKTKVPLRNTFKLHMEKGVNIEGYITKPSHVDILDDNRFRVTLREGKTHQIRRMVAALFNEVSSLKRTRVMNIELGKMKPGEYRILEGLEKETFLKSLGL